MSAAYTLSGLYEAVQIAVQEVGGLEKAEEVQLTDDIGGLVAVWLNVEGSEDDLHCEVNMGS